MHSNVKETLGEFERDLGGIWGELGGEALTNVISYSKTLFYVTKPGFYIKKRYFTFKSMYFSLQRFHNTLLKFL